MNLIFTVNKPIDQVYHCLADMQKFVSVHPIITKIDSLGGNKYRIYETLKFGFIPYSFVYTAIVDHDFSAKSIKVTATVLKFTTIKISYRLSVIDGLTVINEKIEFKSPLPVKPFLEAIFKKQHAQLFKNIEDIKD